MAELECVSCSDALIDESNARCSKCHQLACNDAREDGEQEGAENAVREMIGEVRQGDVIALANAIRIGNRQGAEMALDIISSKLGWDEIVAKGRHRIAA